LDAVATCEAFFDIALNRLVDHVAIQTHHEFFLRFAHDLQCRLLGKLELDGPNGLRKFLQYTKDPNRDRRRQELNQGLQVLEEARAKLNALGRVKN